MNEEIKMAFPGRRHWWSHVTIRCWSGRPNEIEDLKRVSLKEAQFVIVLGDSRDAREADNGMISTLSALRCLPDR